MDYAAIKGVNKSTSSIVYQRHHKSGGPQLRLIRGGLDRRFLVGNVSVTLVPLDRQPQQFDALVKEEDSYLVLSDDPLVISSGKNYETLIDEVMDFAPKKPGSVLIQRGTPLQLIAIVHDLELEPNWREEWVIIALKNILRLTRAYNVKHLALPILAHRHGKLNATRFTHLLCALLEQQENHITRLSLMAPRHELGKIIEYLDRHV